MILEIESVARERLQIHPVTKKMGSSHTHCCENPKSYLGDLISCFMIGFSHSEKKFKNFAHMIPEALTAATCCKR
jgi:hypothetical protein